MAALVNLVYGSCSAWPEQLAKYVVPHVGDRPLTALHDQSSIADAYNAILDTYANTEFDGLVLLHDDLEITDPNFETKISEALEQADLIGVAGGSACGGLAWWNHDPVGHQLTDAMSIDFGSRTGPVDLIEGSVMIFSRSAARELRFDAQFRGFHGYDEIAMQAAVAGMTVLVADIDTHHHTVMGFKSEASHQQWLTCDRQFREKWSL